MIAKTMNIYHNNSLGSFLSSDPTSDEQIKLEVTDQASDVMQWH